MSWELYIEKEVPKRNAVNGRFLRGHVPHNKGKRWIEWMDMRKAKKVIRIGMMNLHGRNDIGGWNAVPIFAIDNHGNIVGWFASSNDAERKTGICARNIRNVLNGKRKTAGGYKWIKQER